MTPARQRHGISEKTQQLWDAVRRFTTGVAVATAGHGDQTHGATVSAFTFISWEPPLVSICLCQGGTLLDLIRNDGTFAVNVLAGDQASTAKHFSDSRRRQGLHQFDGIPWVPAPTTGMPLLLGAVCWLDCRFEKAITMGDHEFVLAEVTSATTGDGVPLLYYAGQLFAGVIPQEAKQ